MPCACTFRRAQHVLHRSAPTMAQCCSGSSRERIVPATERPHGRVPMRCRDRQWGNQCLSLLVGNNRISTFCPGFARSAAQFYARILVDAPGGLTADIYCADPAWRGSSYFYYHYLWKLDDDGNDS